MSFEGICSWCKIKEGVIHWITGTWICRECFNEASERHNTIINDGKDEKKNEGLGKWF